jgi:hypothetical protein
VKIGKWVMLKGPRGQQYFALLSSEKDVKIARALLNANFTEVGLSKCVYCRVKSVHDNICVNCLK